MIRFLWICFAVGVITIFWCVLGLGISLFDPKGTFVHRIVAVNWARWILWVCGVKVHVFGKENLDPSVPRLYLSNHQSYFDILALLAYLPVDFKFVMKEELMTFPLFGLTMRKARYIGIEREDPRRALRGMNEAAEKIAGGVSVVIFPEGTRSVDGELQPFKPGAFHIALKARSDVVPIAIVGSRLIIPKGSLRVQKGEFTIHFGRPIEMRTTSKKEMPVLMEQARAAMLALMEGRETSSRK